WMSPVCMIRPSDRQNVKAPGAGRPLNTDSRATNSMSMNSGSLKPHRVTKAEMSASPTVRPSVSYRAPISWSSWGSACLIIDCSPRAARSSRVAQVRSANLGIDGELGGGPLEGDAARFQHVAAPGDGQRHRGILLDEENGDAPAVDGEDRLEDLLDEDG